MAGFSVIIYGRSWVITEVSGREGFATCSKCGDKPLSWLCREAYNYE